jgi:hypothetical protein
VTEKWVKSFFVVYYILGPARRARVLDILCSSEVGKGREEDRSLKRWGGRCPEGEYQDGS